MTQLLARLICSLAIYTQITACSVVDAGQDPPSLSFEFMPVVFKSGRPAIGESLESAFNSSEFDQGLALKHDVDALKNQPRFRVEIVGFADPDECSGRACYELSERRAKLVYDWLVDHGAPKKCLVGYKGRGAEEPLYRAGEEDVRQRNRRVEVTSLKPAEK